MAFRAIDVGGVSFAAVTERQVTGYVREALERGEGGRILTPNVDILRQCRDPEVRSFLTDATLVVADGMPLVWASRLAGDPLPERVAGANLIWSLSRALAEAERSVFLVGGLPGRPSGARRAAERLARRYPNLRVAGHVSPGYGFDRDPDLLAAVRDEVAEAKPDLVFVGLGFPRQEWLISGLRMVLPGSWFIGCGAAINYVAGDGNRAPGWMQRGGLEWLYRLGAEPGRLAERYLRHDLPYAVRLLIGSAGRRYHHRWRTPVG